MVIFALMGVIGSGKDYLCKKMQDRYMCEVLAFADPVREQLWKELGFFPKTHSDYEKFKITEHGCPVSGQLIPGREIIKNFSLRKKEADPVYFLNRTLLRVGYMQKQNYPLLIISDCRFPKEVEALMHLNSQQEYNVQFIFCNYKSEKYNSEANLESEKLAQHFVRKGFEHQDPTFNHYIYKEFGDNQLTKSI